MPRNDQKSNEAGAFARVTNAVKRLFGRGRSAESTTDEPAMSAAPQRNRTKEAAPAARPVQRQTDIPMDVLGSTYTPPMTSSKAGFRADGADHQRDQEFSRGVADKDWADEDHYTNKSGDPRIGTRGRTYEPGESRAESHD